MAFRFRRTMKIAPGVRLNLTKTGASVRVGARGAGVTTGTSGTAVSAGIPGSGLHASKKVKKKHEAETEQAEVASSKASDALNFVIGVVVFAVFGWIVVALLT